MNDQNKDSLENFFKKGAQNYDIEFREGDWKKMEALLDSEMPVAFSFYAFLKKIWPLIALLLVITLGWYSFDWFSGINTQEPVAVNQNNKMESIPSETYDPILERQNARARFVDSQPKPGQGTISQDPESIKEIEPGNSSSELMIAVTAKGEMANNEEAIYGNAQAEFIEGSVASGGYIMTGNREQRTINSEPFAYRDPGMLFPVFSTSTVGNLKDPDMLEAFPVFDNPGNDRFKVTFTLGAGFSPDFSTVGMGKFVAPGIRWNFMAELGVSRGFMINTGITWVNNKYEAYGEDYHAPPRYWKKGIAADEAYGECVMLDIPLNVRYNFLITGRHQFFISGGASTYILLKEDYYFEYEVEDPELPQHWGTDQVSVYPFKIVNFSIGYQYQLGRKGALQVEPFIKIPTAGVGWGEVDLQTLGVYFMYKYRIGR
jgi:hypothetical protein